MTKRLFQFALMAALTAGLSMGVASCSDDDDEKDGRTAEEQAADPYEKETAAGHALYNLLGQLSVVGDDLPDNWKEATFEPSAGEVTDASQPFVRSIAVNSLDEAVTRYNTLTGRNISSATATDTWQQNDLGSMTFTALNQPACFATVDVSIKQLPQLTQLRFVPVTAFGDNGSFNGNPYYRFGDVVKDPKEGTYWICVRPAYSPNKKEDTHWMSFQLGPKNITDPKKGGCLEQKVPTKLGKDLEKMQYLAQLLAIFARPTAELSADDKAEPFDKVFGRQSFAGNGIGLGGLQQTAMTNEEIIRAAKNWVNLGIWDVVKPSENMTGTAFRESFTNQVSFLYNGYGTSLFNKNLTLYRVTYADPSQFFKNPPQYNDITLDMTSVSFDIEEEFSQTGKCGDESYEAVGDCYVVRYKTGKQLSSNLLFNPSPTEALPGVEDAYRFNAAAVDESISAEKAQVGNIIGKDGKFYANADAARASKTEPAALVIYMNKPQRVEDGQAYHGLAIAVEDLKEDKNAVKLAFCSAPKNYVSSIAYDKRIYANLLDGIDKTEELADKGDSYPAAVAVSKLKKLENDDANFSPWFIPSVGQWILALKGLGFEWTGEAFKGKGNGTWKAAGLPDTPLMSSPTEGRYWAVNEDINGQAVAMTDNLGYAFMSYAMDTECRVRPMIAFGGDGSIDTEYVALPEAPKVGSILCANGLCFNAQFVEYAFSEPRAVVVSVQKESGKIEAGKDWKVLAIGLENATVAFTEEFSWGNKVYTPDVACTTQDFGLLDGFKMSEKLWGGCSNNHEHQAAKAVENYASENKHKVDGGTWFLPSTGQWVLALEGMGLKVDKQNQTITPKGKEGFDKVNGYFPNRKGLVCEQLLSVKKEDGKQYQDKSCGYWMATAMDDDKAHVIHFWNNEDGVKFNYAFYYHLNYVRPFVAL